MAKFTRELSSVRNAAAQLMAYKKQLESRARRESTDLERSANKAYLRSHGFKSDGTYSAHFQPEADGSPADTRPLPLGKQINPKAYGRGYVQDDFASDITSITRAATLAEDAAAEHKGVREAIHDILSSASFDVTNNKVAAEVAPAFLDLDHSMSRHHHHHHHHRRRHHRRHRRRGGRRHGGRRAAVRSAAAPRAAPAPAPIVNNPNPALEKAAAASASAFSSSESRMDSAFHKARADLLNAHNRVMSQLRAARQKEIDTVKAQWRKKALKYNHHPAPTNKEYDAAHLAKLRKRAIATEAKAKAVERSIDKLKREHTRRSDDFDSSRVRNEGDSKEQNAKIGTLMQKLAVARRETTAVSRVMDKFD
jgi:hypothetical protein